MADRLKERRTKMGHLSLRRPGAKKKQNTLKKGEQMRVPPAEKKKHGERYGTTKPMEQRRIFRSRTQEEERTWARTHPPEAKVNAKTKAKTRKGKTRKTKAKWKQKTQEQKTKRHDQPSRVQRARHERVFHAKQKDKCDTLPFLHAAQGKHLFPLP